MTAEVLGFEQRITALGCPEYLHTAERLDTLQLNIGLRCNLQCRHCHVQAGPTRTEEMSRETMAAALEVFAAGDFTVLDITGGAPELNPHYQWLVGQTCAAVQKKAAAAEQGNRSAMTGQGATAGCGDGQCAGGQSGKVLTRTNLVVLTLPEYAHLPGFWAEHGVEVVASLPSFEQRNTDRQRGEGVFAAALDGLRALNAAGFGLGGVNAAGQPLTLNLVLNPGGAFLPPAQASAEREFKQGLSERYGISFDSLLTITNNAGGRFKDFLESKGLLESYTNRLEAAFNPATVPAMMCRTQLSVAWDGRLYDCDFNQVMDLPVLDYGPSAKSGPATIADLAAAGAGAPGRQIRFGDHCYACTAGAGSSCGGATAGT
ncbi:MAG: radical SAM/Cys-rich domain protein [Coriobacteriales bacterium]|jgi:radical SAM/Cys-rich protein|nr:radical SAM/Cys-rich domain protein [Coriobacteriales bacterium]